MAKWNKCEIRPAVSDPSQNVCVEHWSSWCDGEICLVSAKHMLSELLAVIHRDGGHYQGEHGINKAVKDAIDLILQERAERYPPHY
jgi:hypothetical protein